MNMHFNDIEREVKANDTRLGNRPYFDTDKGIWGPASINDCKELFEKINLDQYQHFLDLGSGDGRIVAIAALHTQATGVEFDKNLHELALDMKKRLGNPDNLHFINDDFHNIDLSKYDCIFAFYDKPFTPKIELKLKQEFEGDLYLYQNIFRPKALAFVKIHWINQVPVYQYTTKKNKK
jgi:16S rRNA G966 N2-methylase RsmD